MHKKLGFTYHFSTKEDGNMSVKWGEERVVMENRRRFFATFGIGLEEIVVASLESGTKIAVVGKRDKGTTIEPVDALITTESNVPLYMSVGDCFPTIVMDKTQGILGITHLGYRGILGDLIGGVIERFMSLGSRLADIELFVGPGIKKESYVFDHEKVIQRGFLDQGWGEFLHDRPDGKTQVDLLGFLLRQIRSHGVEHIETSPIDTIADTNYFSHYRSVITGEPEGRFGVVAVMK